MIEIPGRSRRDRPPASGTDNLAGLDRGGVPGPHSLENRAVAAARTSLVGPQRPHLRRGAVHQAIGAPARPSGRPQGLQTHSFAAQQSGREIPLGRGVPGDFRCKNRVVAVHSLRSTPATRQSHSRLPPNSTSSASRTPSKLVRLLVDHPGRFRQAALGPATPATAASSRTPVRGGVCRARLPGRPSGSAAEGGGGCTRGACPASRS